MTTANTEMHDSAPPSINQTEADFTAGGEQVEDAKELLERKKRELLAQVEEIEGKIERKKESDAAQCQDARVTTDELSVCEVWNKERLPPFQIMLTAKVIFTCFNIILKTRV